MMKKLWGALPFTVFVTLKVPSPKNELVESGVHWLRGNARLVVVNMVKLALPCPFVPVICSEFPVRLKWVMTGIGSGPVTTPAVMVPFTARLLVQDRPTADGSVTPPSA